MAPPFLDAAYVVGFMLLGNQPVLGNKLGQMGGYSSVLCVEHPWLHMVQFIRVKFQKLLLECYEAE